MGAKRTKFLVYVDKSTMDEPDVLFQAVMAHFIKKDLDFKLRKEFFAKFFKMSRSGSKAKQLALIDEWVSVRDAVTFPFRKQQEVAKEVEDADQGVEGGVSVDDGTDESPESGVASDGGDTVNGCDDDGDGGKGD